MFRPFSAARFALVLLLVSAAPAVAAGLDAAAINDEAAPPARLPDRRQLSAFIARLEILLDRAHFSPGEIDGKLGDNAQKALRAFAEASGVPFDKAVTAELWSSLTAASDGPAIVSYTIVDADVKGPFVKRIPAKMESMQDGAELAAGCDRAQRLHRRPEPAVMPDRKHHAGAAAGREHLCGIGAPKR